MSTASGSNSNLKCKACGHVQEKGAWEAAMDRQAKARGSKGFVNINAKPQCLQCGQTQLERV